jgi:pantoate--beta-alanine ligase
MRVIEDIKEMQALSTAEGKNKCIGFVPTMGAFHDGHIQLIKKGREECDFLVVSIFVNPIQFCKGEDYATYPRPIQSDKKMASSLGVDVLFVPKALQMYPKGYLTYVNVKRLSAPLCGRFRPGHFQGVVTVLVKLFNIVKPHIAYFGQKDYQQALIVQKMVEDLNFDMKVKVLPTVREEDGLACSSRNLYLSKEQRAKGVALYKALTKAKELLSAGEQDVCYIEKCMESILKEAGFSIDYAQICDPKTLRKKAKVGNEALLVVAARLGSVRLIDNMLWRRKDA